MLYKPFYFEEFISKDHLLKYHGIKKCCQVNQFDFYDSIWLFGEGKEMVTINVKSI